MCHGQSHVGSGLDSLGWGGCCGQQHLQHAARSAQAQGRPDDEEPWCLVATAAWVRLGQERHGWAGEAVACQQQGQAVLL